MKGCSLTFELALIFKKKKKKKKTGNRWDINEGNVGTPIFTRYVVT